MNAHPNHLDRARERERLLLDHLAALARDGAALPNDEGLARAIGLRGHGSGNKVLARLASDGRVVIEGRYQRRIVHIPTLCLSLAVRCSPAGSQRRPVSEIIEIVARTSAMTVADLVGPRRTALYLRPRYLAYRLAREERWSFGDIGRAMCRDHSSVIHGCERAKEMLASDPLFQRLHRRAIAELCGMPRETFRIPARAVTIRPIVAPNLRHPIEVDETDSKQVLDLYRRRRGADQLLSAIQRAHPERCAA